MNAGNIYLSTTAPDIASIITCEKTTAETTKAGTEDEQGKCRATAQRGDARGKGDAAANEKVDAAPESSSVAEKLVILKVKK